MPGEIVAGLATPLDHAQMEQLVSEYGERIGKGIEDAEALRNRIQNAERTIAAARSGRLQGLNPGAIERAEGTLAQLRQDLREAEFWATGGLGIALAWAVAELVHEAAKAEGWRPPSNSVLRLVMPGIVNIAVQLEEGT